MNPGQREPKYEGPEEFDIDRPESGAPTGRWLARGGRVLLVAAILMLVLSLFGRPLLGLFRRPAQASLPAIERAAATVTSVINGVTIIVEIEGRPATVRYLGVDPPEYGTELYDLAAAVNRSWVLGVEVLLERDVTDADLEGRLLRYVWVDDVMINAALLGWGLARHVPGPPDTRYSSDLARIEAEARATGLGIWRPETDDAAGARGEEASRVAATTR